MLCGTREKNLPHKTKKSPAQNLTSLILFLKNMEHMANSKLFSFQQSKIMTSLSGTHLNEEVCPPPLICFLK